MKTLHVVVGLLFNQNNEILIALRPPHVVQPDVWEFPGGKVEGNENLEEALIREYQEEIGITITQTEFFLKIEKEFSERKLILHTYKILAFHGEPRGCENQEIRFVAVDTLKNYTFPDANAGIVKALEKLITQFPLLQQYRLEQLE
ncbi:MAG: 8-oxo-dGTP diphosphatase MutT [Gammaproteobacteria bacterium]|nr:8-oxo-dGTP diphosphatase MutT [Gammaproteobacteria bacterium]